MPFIAKLFKMNFLILFNHSFFCVMDTALAHCSFSLPRQLLPLLLLRAHKNNNNSTAMWRPALAGDLGKGWSAGRHRRRRNKVARENPDKKGDKQQ